jgi:hypothetical protein
VEMLLNHRVTVRSPEGHKQRALTLSRFALRAARSAPNYPHTPYGEYIQSFLVLRPYTMNGIYGAFESY